MRQRPFPTDGRRRIAARLTLAVLVPALSTTGCDAFDADNVLRIEATGLVGGFAYRDEWDAV